MGHVRCPHPDELAGYVYGTLPEKSAQTIADHVEHCSLCDAAVAEYEASADLFLKTIRQPPTADPFIQEPFCEKAVATVAAMSETKALPARTDSPAVAPEQLGPYRIGAKLGQGGMGHVYEATHRPLNRQVALKLLPADRLTHAGAVHRFQREMHAVGQLNHPNIVVAHDAGTIDGQPYLAMELVRGITLSELIQRRGPLEVADACELIRQAAIGMRHAHERGIVHRDIKSSNLMLAKSETGEPAVKILDLGLALLNEQLLPGEELTGIGQTVGTVEYMAPEQGLDSHTVDERADLYSLGATLYKLLSGEVPHADRFPKSPLQLMMARASEPPVSIAEKRELPPRLAQLIESLLAINPADRPSSAIEVADILAEFAKPHRLEDLFDDTLNNSLASGTSSEVVTKEYSPETRLPKGPMRWVVGFGLSMVLLALATVIWLKTDGGYLKIEADPDIEVSLSLLKEGEQVDAIQVGWEKDEVWYRSGAYEIRLPADAKDRLKMTGNKFTLKSRRKHTVTISKITHAEPAKLSDTRPVPPQIPPSQPKNLKQSEADRAFAHWPDGPGRLVTFQIGNEQHTLSSRNPLPEEPFLVVGVVFHTHQGRQATDADVERLVSFNLNNLVTVGFQYQPVKTTWLEAIHKKFPGIKRLEFPATPEHIPIVRKFEQLEYLQISYQADDWIPVLAKKPSLTSLYIQPPLPAEGYATLAALPRLTNLRVVAISDDCLANLAKSQSLKHLVFDTPAHAWHATNRGLAQLARIKTLESILFQRPVVDSIDLLSLKAKLPHCTITDPFETLPAQKSR